MTYYNEWKVCSSVCFVHLEPHAQLKKILGKNKLQKRSDKQMNKFNMTTQRYIVGCVMAFSYFCIKAERLDFTNEKSNMAPYVQFTLYKIKIFL